MHRTKLIGAATFTFILVLGGITALRTGFGSGQSVVQAQSAGPKPVAVETTHPQHRDVARPITLPGDIQAMEETTVYAKVPGYLDRILVDKGDMVSAGQLIANIRTPELLAESRQAQQAYRSAVDSAGMYHAAERKSSEEVERAKTAVDKVKEDYAQAAPNIERARAQLRQAEATERRAREARNQSETVVDESKTQIDKAAADLESARSEQKLADLTFSRYQGIYQRDNKLVAKQLVDEAQSKAETTKSKVDAAQNQLESARARVRSAQAQVKVSEQQIDEATAGVAAAKQAVAVAQGQQRSLAKQLDIANRDVGIGLRQRDMTAAQARQYEMNAASQLSAASKVAAIADYSRIVAPFNGVVTKRFADRGAFIQNASTNQNAAAIVTIANLDNVRVYIHVPESEERFVRHGTPVTITALAQPGSPIRASVNRISSALDPKTRTLLAEVDLPNSKHTLITGGYATGKLALEKHPGVIALPALAVGVEKAGKFVFIVENGKAKRVPVTTGFDDGSFVEIVEGIKGDEEVVVTGRDYLTPGAKVNTTPWIPKKPKS